MDNKEDLLDALEEFGRKSSNDNVPPILEDYLLSVARTGETLFPWCKMKYLFVRKLEAVVADFEQKAPMDASKTLPNVENVCFSEMTERLRNAISKFNGIPFTIQRLCELVTNPHKHYKKTDKFLRGIEKNVMVVSTVDPHGNKIISDQKPLMNGTDGANGFAGDMKTPEKLGMSLISPTPMNSPVISSPHWYASRSGAGDSMASHNTWQQQQLPLVESVSQTAEMCVSEENGTVQENVAARVENRRDVNDASPNDDHSSEAPTATGTTTETEAPAESGTHFMETPTESRTPCRVLEVSEGDVKAAALGPGEGDGSIVPSKDLVSQSTEDVPEATWTETHDNSSADQSLASAGEDVMESATTLDTPVTKCTSPDSSDAATAPPSDSVTSHIDVEASECTSAKRQRRDSGGFDTPVIEGRVDSEINADTDATRDESSRPTQDATDTVVPPDSSNVSDSESDVSPVPVSDSEVAVQEKTTENVVSDSVTCSNLKEADCGESSASSQSSEGSEVVDASPSQSSDGSEVVDASPTQSDSNNVADSGCTQTENSVPVSDADDVSSVAVSDAGDVSSSHHEPMDTN